jgi:hypothetical protein
MAPGLRLFKRQAEDEEVEEDATTPETKIFGKHLHKVKITTPTTTLETDGNEFTRNFLFMVKLNRILIYRTRNDRRNSDRVDDYKDSDQGHGGC